MAESDNLTPLERLQKRLYTPGATPPPRAPSIKEQQGGYAPRGWDIPPEPLRSPKKGISASAMFLIGAVGFFVLAGVAASIFLYLGTRSFSPDRVDISIKGPTTIASGDTVPLIITIENNNAAGISSTLLSVDFPEGTRSADTPGESLIRFSDTVGDIPAGESVTRTVRAVMAGGANQEAVLPVTFEYRTDNSDAVFVKKEQYTFTITTSPVSVSIDTLSQSSSGQALTLSVNVRANGPGPVENIAVVGEYPFGFVFKSASPTPINNNVFELGTLQEGETRTIAIQGVLSGQQNDERVFRFAAGTPRGGGSQALAVTYMTQEAVVRITKPFLAVSLFLNREEADTIVARAGTAVSGLITWANTLPSTVTDGQISIKLSGDALDPRTVTAANGFYRSSDTTVVFNRETARGLAALLSGDTGTGSFTIPMKTGAAMNALRNPTITLAVSIAGKRASEAGVPQVVTSTITRTIKVGTDLTLLARAVRSIGPFTNTGPWPPKADQPSTYTIMLSSSNTVNSVGGARATMSLPSYVSFSGKTSPSDGTIVFNEATREVVWNIGDMPAGTTNKTAAFQVTLLPSASQQGTSPVLVYSGTVSGTDRFTQKQVTGATPPLTTQVITDPGYNPSYGNVIP